MATKTTTGIAKKAKKRASALYKKFHNAVSHEERVIFFNYVILLVVIIIYTVIGISYYATIYADTNDDGVKAVAPYTWFRALYFLTQTMTTVGYGDMYPTTQNARLFTAFYILFGVCLGGTYIGLINSHIQEHTDRLAELRDQEIGKHMAKIHDRKFLSRMSKLLRNGFRESSNNNNNSNSLRSTESIPSVPVLKARPFNKDRSDDDNDSNSSNSSKNSDNGDDDDDGNIKHILKKTESLANLVTHDPYGMTDAEEHKLLDVSEEAFKKELRVLVMRFIVDALTICITVFIGMGIMIRLENWAPVGMNTTTTTTTTTTTNTNTNTNIY